MKISDEVYVHGYVDEIRNGTIIIRNEGGYFGTAPDEVMPSAQLEIIRCKDCVHWFDIDDGRQIHTMCASIDGDWFCGDAERKTDE